ncbi:MAG: sporulation protein YunB [Clostridiales bacterium]|nr:sporulation protein YunB [Clostridiales bacterium]
MRSASKYRRIIIFTIFLILLTVILVQIDKKAFPQIYEMARIQSMNKINNAVNFSVTDISSKMNLTASDFYVKSFDEAGRVCDIAVNTILVNEFCANLAQDISGNLVFMENEKVSLPIGSLSGLYYLANLGPSYSVSVRPMGETRVDYDCSFESVGINQVNFQIWLMVEAKVLVVNPLKRQEIELSRKVSLVNTVITGDVPDTYLNAGGMFGG